MEEKCYQSEQIDYSEIKFIDNQDVLDLIEIRLNGLLPKLDDECKVPKGSDQSYVEKCTKFFADNPRFKARPTDKIRDTTGQLVPREMLFGVNHYAGTVVYNAQFFMEKNKDELLLNVREILTSSKTPFINMLFTTEVGVSRGAAKPEASGGALASPGGSAGGSAKDKVSQSTQFRNQLTSLMDTLNACDPHYVRCVKPNTAKKPQTMEANVALQQLRYAGVFEAVKIRQQGYPFRWSYEHFYKRYRCIGFDKVFKGPVPP